MKKDNVEDRIELIVNKYIYKYTEVDEQRNKFIRITSMINNYVKNETNKKLYIKYLLNNCKDLINDKYLNYYYWHTKLNVVVLEKIINIKSLYKNVDNNVLIKCTKCGCELIYKNIKNRLDFKHKSKKFICYKCREKFKEEKEMLDSLFTKPIEDDLDIFDTIIQEDIYYKYLNYIKSLPYKDYLQSIHWQHFRKEAIKFFRGECQLCNSNNNLNVHHRTYDNLGRETFNDVILLCGNCHNKFHEKE